MEKEPLEEKKSGHTVDRVERILTIIKALQGGWVTQDELCKLHPEYSKRTFYRDLEDLREYLGESIQVNAKGEMHFFPEGTVYLRSLDLTYIEALSLFLLCQLGRGTAHSLPYMEAAFSAMQKLRCICYDLFRDERSDLLDQTLVELSPTSPQTKSDIFMALLQAQYNHFVVQIDYDSIYDQQKIQTCIEPFLVHFTRRAWYVTGRSSFHGQQVRTFHLERIISLKVLTDLHFFVPEGWNYETFRGNAWNMIKGEEDWDIHLHFSTKIARNVASVKWHKTQRIQKNPDGSIEFFVCVSGIQEIIWWILGYGDQVEVISPISLRDEIRKKIQAMQKIYENPASE